VQWAHPKYENLIATCGYDKKIKIWKEVKPQSWDIVYEFEAEASVGAISWAPWEYGLVLAAGSADGKIHIIQRKGDDTWTKYAEPGHDGGVNAISWGPPTEPSMLSLEHSSSQLDVSQQVQF
jgi:protein transport protein SEC13